MKISRPDEFGPEGDEQVTLDGVYLSIERCVNAGHEAPPPRGGGGIRRRDFSAPFSRGVCYRIYPPVDDLSYTDGEKDAVGEKLDEPEKKTKKTTQKKSADEEKTERIRR